MDWPDQTYFGNSTAPDAASRLQARALGSISTAPWANLAQLVEQLTRNEQVIGSNPIVGSRNKKDLR
jgi:hypothetical protein